VNKLGHPIYNSLASAASVKGSQKRKEIEKKYGGSTGPF